MISFAIFVAAAIGVLCSTGFLTLIVFSALRFRMRRRPVILPESALPGVTLLKPLCGLEPRLEDNLESFFRQNYPKFEIIFGTRNDHDPALKIVHDLCRRYPEVRVKVAYSGEPTRPNAKVCSLIKMYALAEFDYFIISDSDVEVAPGYIEEVVRPMLEPDTAAVSCLYRGVPTGGVWSSLEALGMSVEMTSGVLVSDLLEGMKFALGPTMAIRRDALEAIGGMEMLADYCADDYVLGYEVSERGWKVELSTRVVDHIVVNRSFAASMAHQVRWMRSTRFSRPSGHAASVLSFAMPFGVAGASAALALHRPAWGIAVFAAAYANRVIMAVAAGGLVVQDWRSVAFCWLYPVRDLMGFGFWAASYADDTVLWRGERYRLLEKGYMQRLTPSATDEKSVSVAVDDLP